MISIKNYQCPKCGKNFALEYDMVNCKHTPIISQKKDLDFKNTSEKDRYYICEIGRLFFKDSKQCYAPEAVYRAVVNFIRNNKICKCGTPCRLICVDPDIFFCPNCDKICKETI